MLSVESYISQLATIFWGEAFFIRHRFGVYKAKDFHLSFPIFTHSQLSFSIYALMFAVLYSIRFNKLFRHEYKSKIKKIPFNFFFQLFSAMKRWHINNGTFEHPSIYTLYAVFAYKRVRLHFLSIALRFKIRLSVRIPFRLKEQ